ncbi:hypothetical protein [Oribacterium sp. FC2011]|uniref:hypothetical protein n=1 Tax=Oribacterium sp. FC2011 TaxID=1408311 RepID=UPI0004E13407|nr:hypothetical protein [Oribacterium sp. FC2011]
MDTSQITVPYGNNAHLPVQKYRDLLRIWEAKTDGKAIYVILGAEIQGRVHYAMPVKNGLYDWIGYSNQVEETRKSFKKKKGLHKNDAELYAEDEILKIKLTSDEFLSGFRKCDRLIPIITAVIYVGADPWDGPRSLFDMMDVYDKRLIPFLNNYKLNIISAADMDEEDFGKFQTDLGLAMQIIKHQKVDADKIIEKTNHRKIDSDAAFFIKEAAKLDLEFERKETKIDMCESLKKKEQRDKITSAVEVYREYGESDEDIIQKIIKKYDVTREFVTSLMSLATK